MVSARDILQSYGKDGLKDMQLDGEYLLEAFKGNGNPTQGGKGSVNINFRVVSGPAKGQEIYQMFVMSPGSEFAVKQWFKQMDMMGFTQEIINATDPSDEEIAARIVADKVRVKAIIKYDDTYGNKIKKMTESVVKAKPSAKGKAASAASTEDGSVNTEKAEAADSIAADDEIDWSAE